MCFAKCMGNYSPPAWFNACRDNNIEEFNNLLDEYSQNRDTRPFQIVNKKGQLEFQFPTYTGLMYAAIFNNQEIALQLIEEEQDLFTQTEVLVPTLTENSLFKFQINNLAQYNAYKQHKIENFTLIPRSSSILDICLLVGNIKLYFILAQHMERQYVYHVNYASKNNLMYLIELQNYFELQPLSQETQLFYYFMFQRQSLALSKQYENVINQCLKYGNYIILEIVLSLFGKKYKKIYMNFIDTSVIYQQFKKEQQIYYRKKKIIEQLKQLESNNYQPMIEQDEQNSDQNINNNDYLQDQQENTNEQDENSMNVQKSAQIRQLEDELNNLEKITLKTLTLSDNQLQCIMLIKHYEAGIIQQQLSEQEALEDANLSSELKQQLANTSGFSDSSSHLETIQEEEQEMVPANQEIEEQKQLEYYNKENKENDISAVAGEKKIVKPVNIPVNPQSKVKLSKFEQFTKKKKFSQLYSKKLGESDVYKVNTFGQNSVNLGVLGESESRDNPGSIFDHIKESDNESDVEEKKKLASQKESNEDVTDI